MSQPTEQRDVRSLASNRDLLEASNRRPTEAQDPLAATTVPSKTLRLGHRDESGADVQVRCAATNERACYCSG